MPKDNNTRDNTMFALWWCVCVFCLFACVCMYNCTHMCVFMCTCICVMFIFSQECKAWNSELLLLVVRQILHCLHSPHTQPRVTVVGNPWFAPYSRLLCPCDRNFRRFWRSLRAADLCHVSSSSCCCHFVVNHNPQRPFKVRLTFGWIYWKLVA